MSVDTSNDGVFIPPVPMELLTDLPDCYAEWTRCAGRVDWTSFVDFTNIAAAGALTGWRTLFYGPQSQLEHISRLNLTIGGQKYSVPGYSVLANSWSSRHVQNWYGRENLASLKESTGWTQRWTSFKALILEKPAPGAAATAAPARIVVSPTWHIDTKVRNACWGIDPSNLPLADWIERQVRTMRAAPGVAAHALER